MEAVEEEVFSRVYAFSLLFPPSTLFYSFDSLFLFLYSSLCYDDGRLNANC